MVRFTVVKMNCESCKNELGTGFEDKYNTYNIQRMIYIRFNFHCHYYYYFNLYKSFLAIIHIKIM